MVTKRGKLWLTRGVTIGLASLLVLVTVATWLQAGTVAPQWLDVSAHSRFAGGVVVDVGADRVTLRDGAMVPGIWGAQFDGGRAVVGDVVSAEGGVVVRTLLEVTGALTPGTELEFDAAVWDESAALDRFGLSLATANGVDGPVPLWTAPGTDDTWVVFVHGNGADRSQALRLAPVVNDAGYPVIVASYATDFAADSASSRHGFGYDEWRDIDAAIDFGLGQGALDFVLVGYGSGGSIIGAYLYESPNADRVLGVVLDSPMLSLRTAIHDAWVDDGVPGWTIGWTKAIASMRFGLDLGAIDHVERAGEWTAPALLLHGRADSINPISAAEAFAIARGDDALLLTFPGAGADGLWNSDPSRYESSVLSFLDGVAAQPSDFEPASPTD
jgi:pimeloyl-ACP methyl ester carboxylesterase